MGTSKNLWRARFFKIFPSGLFDFEGNPWWIGRKIKEKMMVKYKKYDRQEVFRGSLMVNTENMTVKRFLEISYKNPLASSEIWNSQGVLNF